MMGYQKMIEDYRQYPLVLLTALLFFLLAATSCAATDKTYGLLWEVNKAGAEPAYLFGTIHSEDPDVLQLAQPVQQAFTDSQTVVLEMLLDVDAMRYSGTAMLLLEGRSLSDMIGQPLFSQVATAMQSRGITTTVLERMQPWAAAVVLSMPAPETGQVLDAMLYQQALQQDKNVYGLETVQEQLAVFESLSAADQVILLKDAVANFSEIDAMHAELLAAYKQRDLKKLMAISDASMQQGDQRLANEFQQRLVVDRNHRMVRAYAAVPAAGQGLCRRRVIASPG